MKTLTCLTAMSCIIAALRAPAIAGVFSDATALEAGRIFAQDPRFTSVGVVGLYNNGWYQNGSGVLVGDGSYVLCTGHQVNQGNFSAVGFTPRDANGNNTEFVQAISVSLFPGFTGSGTGQGNDYALIRLERPLTSIAPAPLYSGSDASLVGATFSWAGFGSPGIAGVGLSESRIKFAGQNIINEASAPDYLDSNYLWTKFDGPAHPRHLPLEFMASPGDSGSPWMVFSDGQWQVAALTSGITVGAGYDFGNYTYAASISGARSWINAQMGVVPEPQTYGLVAGGLLVVVAVVRRRLMHRAERLAA